MESDQQQQQQVLATQTPNSIWSKAVRAFSQQKERPVSYGGVDADSVPLETPPEGFHKIKTVEDDDYVASKGNREVTHALTTPVALWNQAIRSISQQKERPSPKSVLEPLDSLPEESGKNATVSKTSSKGVGQKGNSLRRESSSKLSQSSSPRNDSDILDEDMSLDMSRSDSPGSSAVVSRASTVDAKKNYRSSTLAANRNARLKAVGAAPAEPASMGGKGDDKTRAYLGSSSAFEASTLEIQYVCLLLGIVCLCSALILKNPFNLSCLCFLQESSRSHF